MGVTIHDVAQRAEVSVGTVSRYLNGYRLRDSNRTRVEQAINALGFTGNHMARSLRSRKTRTVGVVTPTLQDPFITTMVTNLERDLSTQGYNLLIADYANEPRTMAGKIRSLDLKMVDAIVLFSRAVSADLFDLKPNEVSTPLIAVDEDFPHLPCDKVLLDNVQGSYDATLRLIQGGHRKIAIINGRRDSSVSLERFQGYREAMDDQNIPIDHELVEWGEFTTHGGYESSKRLMGLDAPPTALIVTNYAMTLGCLMAAYELNIRIPAFLSLIGFGNYDLSEIARPPLTVVEQPIEEMSKAVSRILRNRLVDGDVAPPWEVKAKAALVIRESIRDL